MHDVSEYETLFLYIVSFRCFFVRFDYGSDNYRKSNDYLDFYAG